MAAALSLKLQQSSHWTQFGPYQRHSTKRRFPLCNHKGNGRTKKILYNRDLRSCFLFELQMLSIFFPEKSEQLLLPHSRPAFRFEVGKKSNKSVVHMTSLEPIPCCFQFPKLTLFSKVPLVIRILDCQSFFHISFLPINFNFLAHFQPNMTEWWV